MGSFVGARLTEAGWPTAVAARGPALGALRAGPLRLVDDAVEREVRLLIVSDPVEWAPVELALVCTKSFDTDAAAAALAPALAPGAVVLSLQNGVENPAALARACPGAAVGGVAVYLGCQRVAPDRVVRRPSRDPASGRLRDLLAGGGAGAPGEALASVAAALGVPCRVDRSYEEALWTKLVANAALNTVTTLGRARVGARLRRPAGRRPHAGPRAGGGRRRPRLRRPGPPGRRRGVPGRRPPAPAARGGVVNALRPRPAAAASSATPSWAPSCGTATASACPSRRAAPATRCCASSIPAADTA